MHATQKEAMFAAVRRLKASGGGKLIVHRKDGTVRLRQSVQPVDLSPIVVRHIVVDSATLTLREPLRLDPKLDESGQFLLLEHEPLRIMVIATTRRELEEMLEEDLSVLYSEYALADDTELAGAALRIKSTMLDMIEQTR